MSGHGPLWGIGLVLDRGLTIAVLAANALAILGLVVLFFRDRRWYDQLLIALGLFVMLNVVSLAGLRWFARVPVRDVQFFVVD